MCDTSFKKPEKVTVDALGYLSEVLKNGLIKDLQDNQILCPLCKGTGLEIADSVYGLKNDPNKTKMFPYNKQYIVSCNHCYTGVINLCEHCKSELSRNKLRCECDTAKAILANNKREQEKEVLEKAVKLSADDEIAQKMGMYYFDSYPYNNGYFSDCEDFIEWWIDNHDEGEVKPLYVWGTAPTYIAIDAHSIVENACDELHEEALNNVGDLEELQAYLDAWCDKQKGITTYYANTKYAIKIPW